jgi:hypothetical protein
MRKWITVAESLAQSSTTITRWIDAKGALSYIKNDAMIGRVRHWLPKEISGLDKIYAKTGLSFGLPNTRSSWNAHGQEGICFVVDRSKLSNHVCDIDGDAVYEFSHYHDMRDSFAREARQHAISASAERPTEAFVIGNIRSLHECLTGIVVGSKVAPKVAAALDAYAALHSIPVTKNP